MTEEKLAKCSSAGAGLLRWAQKVLELAAATSPLARAQTVQAAVARRLQAKQAQLDKAREQVAHLEEELCALQAEHEAAEKATSDALKPQAAGGGAGSGGPA